MTASFRRIAAGLMALLLLISLPVSGPYPAEAQENSRYAAIVVDATTGEVLFSRHADDQRYPASVTKVMTLYLAFEALSQGKVNLDDVLTVSPRAASQPPSKLGLGAGQTIRLDDALRATAVRSANDMAMSIAEHVGGSQGQFATMATAKARQLGMTQTRYVNPNGLPDSRQVTSARDLAILSRAVMRDYPQYYRYFGLHDWAYNGRDYRNTNGLLVSGQGYDGIKTGYINAAGYNLAASAVRNNHRVITIVLGGRSSATRNAHVAELMDTGFEVLDRRDRGENIQIAQAYFEARGYGVGNSPTEPPVAYAALTNSEEEEDGAMGSNEVAYTALPPQPAPAPRPVATPPAPVRTASTTTSYDSVTALLNSSGNTTSALTNTPLRATTPAAPPPRPAPAGRWSVQVGAFRDQQVATSWLGEVNRRFTSSFRGAERSVQSADGWYRSRFTGMTEDAARAACDTLDARRVTCLVVQP